MVWASPADPTGPERAYPLRSRMSRGRRGRDCAPGAEVVGACQSAVAWALLLATQQASPVRYLVLIGAGSVAAVAVGFLQGLLLVKPMAVLGHVTARLTAWPEPIAVLVLVAPASALPALPAHWWLRDHLVSAPGFGTLWACTAASAVLPVIAGACFRVRPVPLKALWGRGLAVTAAAVAVVTTAGLAAALGV
ncbi:hypothetical protein ABZZ20_12870 [Streptomyces sp. NPDC006430]|uniref:hypothetical protein n=1 Tax=Streptomyces sp. NPDC006430 TaxID=3154299 RepID=UPI0033A363F6